MTTSIGGLLKAAREKKELSHEEVHAKIKIHPRVLQLMEEDKFEKLPSPLFAKSFLRSYADFLQIDSEEVVRNYEKQGRREPEQVLYLRPAEARRKSIDTRWVAPAAAAALIIAALFLLYLAGSFVVKKATSFRPAKPAAARAQTVKAPVRTEGDSTWLRSPSQGNFPKIDRRTPLHLKIKALDNVWMRVTCDGKIVFQSILKRGVTESWTAMSAYEIWTGNSSNMSLTLNGTPLGSPGKGVVKKMVIDRDGVRNRS